LNHLIESLGKLEFLKLIDLQRGIKNSLIKGNKIKKFLEKNLFGKATLEHTKIPLYINATDFSNGKSVFFENIKMVDAVMASICIPGIFPPYALESKYYVDGGVSIPMPFDILFAKGMDKVLSINLNAVEDNSNPLKFSQVLLRVFDLIQNKLSSAQTSHEHYILNIPFSGKLANILRFHDYQKYFSLGLSCYKTNKLNILKWLESKTL
jgi:NTE family protein